MKTKQPSILIPDQCDTPLAYYVIRCLKQANSEFKINVIVSSDQVPDGNAWQIFYKYSRYVDNLIFAKNKISSQEYLNEVIQSIENAGIDIVFPASEGGFKFVSKYRNELSKFCRIVALPSHENLYTGYDKWSLYLSLKDTVPVPKTVLLTEIEQFSQSNYPLLLKPIDGAGGKNIQKLDTWSKEIQTILNNPNEVYIVQEYIDGYDIDCNVLCQNGQVVAYTIQQPLGVEEGFSPRIDKLKFVHDSNVYDIVSKTMNVLQWSGVAHLDLRYNCKTGQLNLIEINPRFWQSLMASLSVGVNFPYLLYLLSSDISFGSVSYQEKYYAKVGRFVKDALNGSLEYSLSDTNVKYLFSDPNSVFQFMIHRFLNKRKSFKN